MAPPEAAPESEILTSEPPSAMIDVVCAIKSPAPVVRPARVPNDIAVPVVRPVAVRFTNIPVVAITPVEAIDRALPVVKPFAIIVATVP